MAKSGARFSLKTQSAEETGAWGARLAAVLPAGAVLALEGDLGAGKTTLVRGICEGLGVADLDAVASPTFTLLNEYEGQIPVAHFDFYRLDSINSLPDLGYEDALDSGAVVIVEWAEKFPEAFPAARTLTIRLAPSAEGPDARQIEIILPVEAESAPEWQSLRRFLKES